MRLDEHWRVLLERGLDLVVTTGIVATEPAEHAISRIPGEVEFSCEVRSQSHDSLEAFYELFRSECRAVGAERRGQVRARRPRLHGAGADGRRRYPEARRRGRAHRFKTELLPSGAGHDAAVFANAGIPSGMIFVRNANGSHNPDEAMDIDDFMKGVDLLFAAVAAPA
jgi:N-carbamoyl-L-amino-acid hydrolase